MVFILRSEKVLQMLGECMTNDCEERTNKSELSERQHCTAVDRMGTAAGVPRGAALGPNSLIHKMGENPASATED